MDTQVSTTGWRTVFDSRPCFMDIDKVMEYLLIGCMALIVILGFWLVIPAYIVGYITVKISEYFDDEDL